jgi:hypothetical protein
MPRDGTGHMGELKAFLAVGTGPGLVGSGGLAANHGHGLCRILPESVANFVDKRGLLRAHDNKCQ